MTNNRGLVNLRILGIMIIAVSILLVTTGTQNAMATAAIIVEEAAEAEAGNATMTAAENQTANGNMTGTNSTG